MRRFLDTPRTCATETFALPWAESFVLISTLLFLLIYSVGILREGMGKKNLQGPRWVKIRNESIITITRVLF